MEPGAADRSTLAGWHRSRRTRATPPYAVPAVQLALGDTVGRYRIGRKIGSGGMADVYEATRPGLDQPVALKVARSDDDRSASFARLEAEAEILADLRHHAVVRVFDVGWLPGGVPWFTMELIAGETLLERLERGPLDLAYGCEILAHLASALRAALHRGVVHRDIKPDNVILQPGDSPRCKLIDWGIARDQAATVRHTQVGLCAGTPGYMAPEQARGHEVDWRSDVYALGATAYEMFCGAAPFAAPTPLDLVLKHLSEPPPPPRQRCPEMPPRLEQLIVAMLAKNPADRPRLADLEVQLRAIARSLYEPELDIVVEYDVDLDVDDPAETDGAEDDVEIVLEPFAPDPVGASMVATG